MFHYKITFALTLKSIRKSVVKLYSLFARPLSAAIYCGKKVVCYIYLVAFLGTLEHRIWSMKNIFQMSQIAIVVSHYIVQRICEVW